MISLPKIKRGRILSSTWYASKPDFVLDSEGMKQLADVLEKEVVTEKKDKKGWIAHYWVNPSKFTRIIKFLRG